MLGSNDVIGISFFYDFDYKQKDIRATPYGKLILVHGVVINVTSALINPGYYELDSNVKN